MSRICRSPTCPVMRCACGSEWQATCAVGLRWTPCGEVRNEPCPARPATVASSSAEFGKVFFPELTLGSRCLGIAPGGLAAAQLDPADLARDRLWQFGEFEAADAFIGCQMLAQMAIDRQRRVAARS